MKFVVDVCMDAVLGDIQLSGNVTVCYSSVCHDDVMNLGNGLVCGYGDWPSRTGVVFQIIPATFESISPHLHNYVSRGIIPYCDHNVFMDFPGCLPLRPR